MLENCIARSVPGPISGFLPDRRRCRRPENAALLIADVERLHCRVEHRVVGPAGETIALAVAKPGETGPGFTDQCAEARVGNDIHPWRRGIGAGTEIDRIFTPVRSKTAQAVEVVQLHEGERSRGLPGSTFTDRSRRQFLSLHRHTQLLCQRTACRHQHDACCRLKEIQIFLRDLGNAFQEDSPGPI